MGEFKLDAEGDISHLLRQLAGARSDCTSVSCRHPGGRSGGERLLAPAIPPEDSGTLKIGARSKGEAPSVVTDALFAEPLLAIDLQGRPTERLATSWKWENDGRALRLTLRPSVQFHDGTPVTGAAVAAILKQEIGRGGYARLRGRGWNRRS